MGFATSLQCADISTLFTFHQLLIKNSSEKMDGSLSIVTEAFITYYSNSYLETKYSTNIGC